MMYAHLAPFATWFIVAVMLSFIAAPIVGRFCAMSSRPMPPILDPRNQHATTRIPGQRRPEHDDAPFDPLAENYADALAVNEPSPIHDALSLGTFRRELDEWGQA